MQTLASAPEVWLALDGDHTLVAARGRTRAFFSRVFRRSRMKGWFLIRNTPVSMPAHK